MHSLSTPSWAERIADAYGMTPAQAAEAEAATQEWLASLYSHEESEQEERERVPSFLKGDCFRMIDTENILAAHGKALPVPKHLERDYRGFVIQCDPTPIPDLANDWLFYNPDNEEEYGRAPSREHACATIDDIILERT